MRKSRKERSKERKRWSRKFLDSVLLLFSTQNTRSNVSSLCSIFWMLSFLKLNMPKFMIWHPSPFLPAQGQGYVYPIPNSCRYFSMIAIPAKLQLSLCNLHLEGWCAGTGSVQLPPPWMCLSPWFPQNDTSTRCHAWLPRGLHLFLWCLNITAWNLQARHQAGWLPWILTRLRVEFQVLVFLRTTVDRTMTNTRCSVVFIT